MNIAVLFVSQGRETQARWNAERMIRLAGHAHSFAIVRPRSERWGVPDGAILIEAPDDRTTYWQRLNVGLGAFPDATHFVYVGNDHAAGTRWLAYLAEHGDGKLVAANDGVHHGNIATIGMIDRALLERWYPDGRCPEAYRHNFGDVELTTLARRDGAYAYEPDSVLYHQHPIMGWPMDEIYKTVAETNAADAELFEQRRQKNFATHA